MSKKEFYPTFEEVEEFDIKFGKKQNSFDTDYGDIQVNPVISPDYNLLDNKPKIENVELKGDKTFKQLGLDTLSVQEIEKILYL